MNVKAIMMVLIIAGCGNNNSGMTYEEYMQQRQTLLQANPKSKYMQRKEETARIDKQRRESIVDRIKDEDGNCWAIRPFGETSVQQLPCDGTEKPSSPLGEY